MELYKLSEWENMTNDWYVGHIKNLSSWISKWWVQMRLLEMSPEDFVNLLINTFNVKKIKYLENNDVLIFSFYSKKEALKYKNYINKKAKEKKFFV